MIAPEPLYPANPECLLVAFNLRHPDAQERLRQEEAAWFGSARIERLSADSAVLFIWPGGPRGWDRDAANRGALWCSEDISRR